MNTHVKYNLKDFAKVVGPIIFISLFFTVLTFFVEQPFNEQFSPNNFLWWWISTVSTVGYGDIVPVTDLGKFFGSVVVFTSILFIAVGVSQINQLFTLFAKARESGLRKLHFKDHVVIINESFMLHSLTKLVSEIFPEKKIVIFNNTRESYRNPSKNVFFYHGNPSSREDLTNINIAESFLCLILSREDMSQPDIFNIVVASEIERINSKIVTIVDLIHTSSADEVRKYKPDVVISQKQLADSVAEHSHKLKEILKSLV